MRITTAVTRRAGLLLVPAVALAAACSEAGPVEVARIDASGPAFHTSPDPALHGGIVDVCLDASSPSGTSFSVVYDGLGNGFLLEEVTWTGKGEPRSFDLTPGACREVWHKHDADHIPVDPQNVVTVVQTNQPTGTLFNTIVLNNGTVANATLDDAAKTATLAVNRWHGFKITFSNTQAVGSQGCTPGFWKNTKLAWPIDKATNFNGYFGTPNWFPNTLTLGQAVGLNGGGMNALARHATAGALNAAVAGVDYPYNVAQVKAYVQAAYNGSASIEGNKNILEAGNELGCPLSNGGK